MTSNGNGKINYGMFICLYTKELFLSDLRKKRSQLTVYHSTEGMQTDKSLIVQLKHVSEHKGIGTPASL